MNTPEEEIELSAKLNKELEKTRWFMKTSEEEEEYLISIGEGEKILALRKEFNQLICEFAVRWTNKEKWWHKPSHKK